MKSFCAAIPYRCSCRSFNQSPPASEQWNELKCAAETFSLPGTRIILAECDNALFSPFFGLLMKFENTQRFAAIITTDDKAESIVNAGICGEMLMLSAVSQGLGGVWVAGTYKRKDTNINLAEGETIRALIALGIPADTLRGIRRDAAENQPSSPANRKRKPLAQICSANFSEAPAIFQEAAVAVQAAPSAMNMQPWQLAYEPGESANTLSICVKRPSQRLDLGIAVCHAMLAFTSSVLAQPTPSMQTNASAESNASTQANPPAQANPSTQPDASEQPNESAQSTVSATSAPLIRATLSEDGLTVRFTWKGR